MLITLLLSLLLQAHPSPRLTVTFIGNEAVQISDGTTTLLTDFPYQSGYSGYMTYDLTSVKPAGTVLSLITHRHADHFDARLFAETSWQVMGPSDALRRVDAARAVPLGSTFGPLQVEPVETPHASVEHYSYTVSWAGRRFYFVGDTDSTEALLAARNLDVAFVSPWLLNEVLRSGRTIDARRIVIYHQAPGESLPSCKTCTVLRQGESFIVP